MQFDEVVNILAQNGLRMVYLPDKHMSALELIWKKKNYQDASGCGTDPSINPHNRPRVIDGNGVGGSGGHGEPVHKSFCW